LVGIAPLRRDTHTIAGRDQRICEIGAYVGEMAVLIAELMKARANTLESRLRSLPDCAFTCQYRVNRLTQIS
jgi:hypothetical protein